MATNTHKIKELPSQQLVINMNGTVDGNWKELWEQTNNKQFGACSAFRCTRDATVGGHVRLADKKGKEKLKKYIIPLCAEHNSVKYKDIEYKIKTVKAVRAIQHS